jgi:hypothetical protein
MNAKINTPDHLPSSEKALQRISFNRRNNMQNNTSLTLPAVSLRRCMAFNSTGQAVLVDVRTNEERKFVGYVPESVHVAWATVLLLTEIRAS